MRKSAPKGKRKQLRDVKVPKKFAPIFVKAQRFVEEYFSDFQRDTSKGTLTIAGERYLLVRAASMSVDFIKAVKELYKGAGEDEALEVARSLLFDIAHAIGRADAHNFHKKMKVEKPVEKLSAGPIHFAHSGWAFVDIFPESRPTPDENYYLIYDHPFSFESAAWIKARKKSSCPVCVMNAGYSSGWCEASFGVTLVAQEIMCKAAGDKACRFIMAPPSKIEGHIERYLKGKPALRKKFGTYEIPGFFKRKQIEQNLRASEEAFRVVFENANDAIFWADPKTGVIVNCNKAAERLIEREKKDIVGIHQTALHPPEEAKRYTQVFKKDVDGKHVAFPDVEVITASGKRRPVEISASVTQIGDRQIVQGIFRDVTERKKAERKIKHAAEEWSLTFDSMADGITIHDTDFNILNVNQAICVMLGISKEHLIGKKCYQVFHGTEEPIDGCPLKSALRSKKVEYTEVHEPRVGKWLAVSASPMLDEKGEVVRVIHTVRDITERKKREGKLQNAKLYLDSMYDALMVMNMEGEVVEYNRGALNLLGYGPDEKPQLRIGELIPEWEKGFHYSKINEVTQKGETLPFEAHIIRRDGKEVPVLHSSSAIFDEEGKATRIVGVFRDITDMKHVEDELRAARNNMEQRVMMRTQELQEANKHLDSERKFAAAIINSSFDGIAVADMKGTLTYLSPAAESALGYAIDEIPTIEKWAERVFPDPEMRRRSLEAWNADIENPKPPEHIFEMHRKDGSTRLLRFQMARMDHSFVLNIQDVTERRRAEEALRKSQHIYQTLAEAAEDYIFIIGPDMEVQYVNKFAARQLDRNKNDVVGKKLSQLFPPKEVERMSLAIKHVFATGKAISAENPLAFPGGELWLHTHLVPLKGDGRDVTSVMGLSRDVTARRGYEERLRLTQTTMDHVGNAIYWMGPDAKFVYVNDQACKQLGYSRQELLSMTVHDIDPLFPKEAWLKHWKDVREKKSFTLESRHRRKDGNEFPIEVMVNYLEHEGREFNCAIVLDITERKKAEEELRKLASVVEYSSELINLATPDGRMVFLNEAGREMLGIDFRNIENTNIMEVIPESLVEMVESELLPTLMKGGVWEGDLQYKNVKTGKLTDVHATTFSIRDPDTQEIKFLANASMDITERKKAEDALRESEARLRTAVESLPFDFFIIGPDGRYAMMNTPCTGNWGNLVGKRPEEVDVDEATLALWKENNRRAFAGEIVRGEVEMTVYGGKKYFYNIIAPIRAEDKIYGVLGCNLDITERKQAEEALRESEARYRSLFENSPVSLWEEDFSQVKRCVDRLQTEGVCDMKEHFLAQPKLAQLAAERMSGLVVNQAALDMFGAKSRDELWRGRMKIINEKTRPLMAEILAAIAQGKTSYHGEGSGSTLAGDDIEVAMSFAVLPGFEDTYGRVLISITDITQRKLAEEELRRAIKLKSDFMAMVSHELRTPLTRIISSAHLVLSDPKIALTSKRRANINNVLASSDTLLIMINNVLEMARLEGGKVPIAVQKCDLKHLIRSTVASCEGLIGERNLHFAIHVDDDVASIKTDKEKLGHVIINLVSNAIRYSESGTIEITVKPSACAGCVDISVKDEGVGIPQDKIPLLFQRFQQLEEVTKRRPGGIGLGLAIVKANIDLLGGTIDVSSEVNKGSTFTVTIPTALVREMDKG